MKKISLFVTLMAICLHVLAWDSPITIPNVGDARLRIVEQNAQNYMTNFEASNASCSNQSDFDAKTNKMANVFLALQADIVIICEAERNATTLGYISSAMNTISGTSVYTYLTDNIPSSTATSGNYQAIKTGFIYRTDKVRPVGNTDSPYYSGEYFARMRIQMFEELSTGEQFWLSANHFKAKGGSDNGESTRLENAANLISKLSSLTSGDDPDVLIMGDLNAYTSEDPITSLEVAGYSEQLTEYDLGAYTYVYNNEPGILDHAMANVSMAGQITGAYAYNINHCGNYSYKYSDHDAVLVGLKLGSGGVTPVDPPVVDCPSFSYDFRSGTNGFTIYDISGSSYWGTSTSYGLTISGYQKEDGEEHWCFSPALDLSKATSATLILYHQIYKDNGEQGDYVTDQTVWVSTNYESGNPYNATWTQLVLPNYPTGSYGNSVVTIPASCLTSNTHIAFKFLSPLEANSNFWEIKTASITAECESATTTYSIIFRDDDGTILCNQHLTYGDIPYCAEPTKPATAQYTYTFAGWVPTVVPVTGDATYTATYTATPVNPPVDPTGLNNIGTNAKAVKVLRDGQLFIIRNGKIYTVTGQEVR